MSKLWQYFVRHFGDDEFAGMALLVAIGAVLGTLALLVHWLRVGQYATAVGFALALGAICGVCLRDFRRGRWSRLSTALVTLWLLATIALLLLSFWIGSRAV